MLKPTLRNNPCEICSDIKGKCRVSTDNTDLVLCFNTADKHSTPPGWTFRGLDKAQGIWGMLFRGEEKVARTAEEKKAWAIEQAAIRAADKIRSDKAEAELIATMPPAVQRDRYFRRELVKNPLSLKHRAALHKKGCTDELIKSMEAYSSPKGWAVATRNLEGLRTGAQYKPNGENVSGYKWEGYQTNKLRETGQYPLAICGNRVNPTLIVLVEGLTIKPNKAAFEHPDWLLIGASGGMFIGSSQELLTVLNRFPSTPIALMPDGGSISNVRIVRNYTSARDLILQATGRETLVGWWNQLAKSDGDIDEIEPSTTIELIEWNRFESLINQSQQASKSIYSFRQLENNVNKKRILPSLIGTSRETAIGYATTEELIEIAEDAIANPSIKAVLDISPCGTGKSTIWGSIDSIPSAAKLIYVSNQHRNPTTEGVRLNYSDVPSRHNGLYVNPDKTTDTYAWLQTTEPKDANWHKTASNCMMADSHKAWRDTGFDSPEGKNPICALCPHNDVCHTSSGDGWGYKYQKLGALAKSKIRTSPMSLAATSQFDYSKAVTIWDDEAIVLSRKLTATKNDISKTISTIYGVDKDLALQLDSYFTALSNRFAEPIRYGHSHEAIVCDVEIDNIGDVLNRVASIVQPDLSNLHVEGAQSKEHALEKWGFSFAESAKTSLDDITANWLVWSLEILAGKVRGSIHIDGNKLTIRQRDSHHATIADKAALTVILNTTKDRNDLALELNIKPEEILVISQAFPDYSNLTLTMVNGMGSKTAQVVKSFEKRVDELQLALAQKHNDCSVLDHTKDNPLRARWFVDHIGSNAFENDSCMLMMGQPRQNLGSIAEDYYMLTGDRVSALDDNPDYQSYVKRRIASDVIQAIGRPRAHRRPDQEVNVYLACDREDYPISEMMAAYPTATLKVIDVEDICLTSARSRVQLRAAFAQLKLANPKITRAQAAIEMKTSPANLAAMFKEFGTNFKDGSAMLYKALMARTELSNSDYSNWSQWLTQEIVDNHLAILDNAEITEEVKSEQVVESVEPLTQPQTSALFTAIGYSATQYTIELLRLNLALRIPTLTTNQANMLLASLTESEIAQLKFADTLTISKSMRSMADDTAKNGETMADIAEGLQYAAQNRDAAALSIIRNTHKDDKESLLIACELLNHSDFQTIKEMVIKINSKKLVLKR